MHFDAHVYKYSVYLPATDSSCTDVLCCADVPQHAVVAGDCQLSLRQPKENDALPRSSEVEEQVAERAKGTRGGLRVPCCTADHQCLFYVLPSCFYTFVCMEYSLIP